MSRFGSAAASEKRRAFRLAASPVPFTDSRRAEEEEDEGVLFIVPAVLLPPDGCGEETEGWRRGDRGDTR